MNDPSPRFPPDPPPNLTQRRNAKSQKGGKIMHTIFTIKYGCDECPCVFDTEEEVVKCNHIFNGVDFSKIRMTG